MEPAGNPNPLREWPRLGDGGGTRSNTFDIRDLLPARDNGSAPQRNLVTADYIANGPICFTATYGVPGILRTLTKNAYFGNQPPPRLDSITFCRDVQRMAFREFATCSSGH